MSMIYYPENIERVAKTFSDSVTSVKYYEQYMLRDERLSPYLDGSVFWNTETERLECYAYVTVAANKGGVDDWDGVAHMDMSKLFDWQLIELMDREPLDATEDIIEIEPHPVLPLIYGRARDA